MASKTMSNTVCWWTVENRVEEILKDGSLIHTLKKPKRIQRRTRVLNAELKKFAGLKSYREYVAIKTDILRNIPDNEDTDDEPLARSAIEATSFINDERDLTNDFSNRENEEEAEEQQNKTRRETTSLTDDKRDSTNDLSDRENEEEAEEDQNETIEATSFINDKRGSNDFLEHEKEEDTDEEQNDTTIEATSFIDDKRDSTDDFSERTNQEHQNETTKKTKSFINYKSDSTNDFSEHENEEKHHSEIVSSPQKKLQPKITCTEIVKSKYTIVRDAEEAQDKLNKSHDKPVERKDESDEQENALDESQGELEVIEDNRMHESENESLEIPAEQIDERQQEPMENGYEIEASAPIDISIDDDDDENRGSAEERRVSRLRRFNLLYENSESDSSQDFDFPHRRRYTGVKESSHSQAISDPSDSEVQTKIGYRTEVNRSRASNYAPSVGSSFHISDSDDDNIDNVVNDDIRKKRDKTPVKSPVRKSLRSQIDEQEAIDLEKEITENDAPKVSNKGNTGVPSEADSLRYVLRNLSSNCTDVDGDSLRNDYIHDQNVPKNRVETLPRPMELEEFIEREELVTVRETSTINLKDIKSWSEQDGDEEIFLMEIPRSIVTDRELRGKRIGLKRDKIKIDSVSYKTINRHDRPVSCILSTGKKRGRFTTVNIKPVGSMVVCQESTETRNSAAETPPIVVAKKSADLVPFPSNVKSRNPLIAVNTLQHRPKLDSSPLNHIRIENKSDSVKKKKLSKKQKSNVLTTDNIIKRISKKFASSRPKKGV